MSTMSSSDLFPQSSTDTRPLHDDSVRYQQRRLSEALNFHFGYKSFRENQEEAINAILNGRDALCCMSTGSGKSLLYQLPGIALNDHLRVKPASGSSSSSGSASTGDDCSAAAIVLVVSPLLSLIHDQVAWLRTQGTVPGQCHNTTDVIAVPAQTPIRVPYLHTVYRRHLTVRHGLVCV
jgi:superfamily II DNA helicase RecQ